MKNPVFLIGPPRSGTTLLGEQILSKYAGIKYLSEINHIWKYSNVYKKDEELGINEINRFNKKKIRSYFDDVQKLNPDKIIVEKTPTNCLRIPFIHHLFPDAKYIFIYRNGYSTSLSLSKEWSNTGKNAIDSFELRNSSFSKRVLTTIKRQINLNKRKYDLVDLYEFPYYFYRLYLFLIRNIFPAKSIIWGPRIPKLRNIAKKNELLDTCTIQWNYCIEKVIADSELIVEQNKLFVYYEDLIISPEKVVTTIVKFLGEEQKANVSEMISSIVDRGSSKSLRDKFSVASQRMIDKTNVKLGYTKE